MCGTLVSDACSDGVRKATGIGDEGGFAPPISQPHEALDLLVLAVENCGHTGKIKFAIDPASSEFFDSGKYNLGYKDKSSEEFSPEQLAKLYNHLIDEYPIVLLEDPFAQDDWDSWSMFNTSCKIELVGDDLLATNAERIKLASDKKACNSLLLKINQIGTISEAISAYVVLQNLLADSPSPVMSVLTIIQCEYGIRPRLECFCLPSLRRDHGRLHRRLDGRATDRPSQVRKSMSR